MCECDDALRPHGDVRAHLHRRRFLQSAGAGAVMLIGGRYLRPMGAAADDSGGEDTGASGARRAPTRELQRAPINVPPPIIIPRSGWGADESLRTSDRTFAPVQKLIVHHSATPLSADPTADIRAIYKFHIEGRDWADIAYNFVVDQAGRVYEGRWAREYADAEPHTGESVDGLGVVGAHTLNFNTGSCGVVLLGDFTKSAPSDASLVAAMRVLAWKAGQKGIDVSASDQFTNFSGETSVFPNITGHRDLGITECPGTDFYSKLPSVRAGVAARTQRGLIGYRVLSTDGHVRSFGGAFDLGDPARIGAAAGVAIAAAQDADSYWVMAADGAVFTFGNAQYLGSLPDQGVRAKAADIAGRPGGGGYWVLGTDGAVYPFGAAVNLGGLPNVGVRTTARKIRPTPTGNGYWILGEDGGIFTFGDASFFGSVPGVGAKTAAVDLSPTPSGQGYWVLGEDGGVFTFGDAQFFGSIPALKVTWSRPARAIMAAFDGGGYHVMANDGGVFSFGNVPFYGSLAGSGRRPSGIAPAVQL
ncbi:MAG TPA: N-acetylmuramoyl-L-alanine amidase [Acidimicrobiales bacterium]|nr:N-acetylmuramoyl-L-alanine amidase [Acidimicrobiales bacterium]